jgi:hypothetical protein
MRTRVIGSENMDLILDDDNTRRQVWQVAYKGEIYGKNSLWIGYTYLLTLMMWPFHAAVWFGNKCTSEIRPRC